MATFYIYGDITERTAFRFNRFVRSKILYTDIKELMIYIHSNGGEYESACSIIDTIMSVKLNGTKIITVIDGKAYSAAGFIFCFGDVRLIQTHGVLMLHPIFYDMGNQSLCDIKPASDFMATEYNKLLQDIHTHCNLNITIGELYDRLRHNWWMHCEEAIQYGFATERLI